MEIETSRFGVMSVDDQRIINFPHGLLGFPEHKRYALIQTGRESCFFWLQSVEDAGLAFVVTDPNVFFRDYDVPLRDELVAEMQMADVPLRRSSSSATRSASGSPETCSVPSSSIPPTTWACRWC